MADAWPLKASREEPPELDCSTVRPSNLSNVVLFESASRCKEAEMLLVVSVKTSVDFSDVPANVLLPSSSMTVQRVKIPIKLAFISESIVIDSFRASR